MKRALLTLAIVTVTALAARADVELAWDVSGHGTPADTTLPATTINANLQTASGLNELMRINGTTGAAAGNSFNSTNWNNTTNTFDDSLRAIGFTLQPTTNITLTDLQYAINGSNTAPNTGRWGYSLDGGAPGTFVLQDPFTITNPAPSGLTTWDFADVSVAAGTTVRFQFWAYGTTSINGGTSSSSGTVRIANVSGNDLVLNGTAAAIPEPATLGLLAIGLAGVAAFARRRSHKA